MTIPITVMLIDDEPLALENVYDSVQWEEHGFEVVAKATNGRIALRQFEQMRPNIVISDISMPQMDGLEMGKLMIQMESETRLIFLTAYRDFDYVRQALELRAAHYLLKHEISRNRLLDQLLELKTSIENERKDKEQKNRSFLRDLLLGRNTKITSKSNTTLHKELMDKMSGILSFLYFEVHESNTTLSLVNPKYLLLQREDIRLIEREILKNTEEVGSAVLLEMEDQGYILLLKLSISNSKLLWQYVMHKISQLLQHTVSNVTNKTPKIIISASTDKEQLYRVYTDLKQAYEYSLFLPPRSIFLQEQVPSYVDRDSLIDKIGQLPAEPVLLQGVLKDVIRLHDARALKVLIRRMIDLHWIDPTTVTETDLVKLAHLLEQNLNERAQDKQKKNHYSRWVSKAIDYVHQHYGEVDLSLEKVADILGISSVHLRTTFKKETGHSLLDYTTKYRIETAMGLLMTGEYKIYEVAEKVGYSTSQYFSQVFKKHTGIHPKDYIRQENRL